MANPHALIEGMAICLLAVALFALTYYADLPRVV